MWKALTIVLVVLAISTAVDAIFIVYLERLMDE